MTALTFSLLSTLAKVLPAVYVHETVLACVSNVVCEPYLGFGRLSISTFATKLVSDFYRHCHSCSSNWMAFRFQASIQINRQLSSDLSLSVSYHARSLTFLAEPKVFVSH